MSKQNSELELKADRTQAKLNAVTVGANFHGSDYATAGSLSLEILTKPELLDQLSGEIVSKKGFRDWYWRSDGSRKATGLGVIEFATILEYQVVKIKIGRRVLNVPKAKISKFKATIVDNFTVKLALLVSFECEEDDLGHIAGKLKRQEGIGITFLGIDLQALKEDEDANEQSKNQSSLKLGDQGKPEGKGNVVKLPGTEDE